MKRCPACRCDKPESEFHRDRSNRDGLQSCCKVCGRARTKKRRSENPKARKKESRKWYLRNRERIKKQGQKNPEAKYRAWYKRNYGISLEQYDRMLLEQNGVCAICDQPESRRRLSVDHDHATGKVRALLCNHCNRGLGAFRDREDLTAKATGYLRRFKTTNEES